MIITLLNYHQVFICHSFFLLQDDNIVLRYNKIYNKNIYLHMMSIYNKFPFPYPLYYFLSLEI